MATDANALDVGTIGNGDPLIAFDLAVRNVVNSTRRFVAMDASAMDGGTMGCGDSFIAFD